MTDDIRSMEVSGYLCTLTSAGLVGIESSRNIYVPTATRRELEPSAATTLTHAQAPKLLAPEVTVRSECPEPSCTRTYKACTAAAIFPTKPPPLHCRTR